MPRWRGSRSTPSCFEPHGMDDGNFETLRGEALSVIDRRGDYATRRNVKRMRRVDDDDDDDDADADADCVEEEEGNSMPT